MAIAMFGTGLEFMVWPDALARSKLQFMLDIVDSHWFTVYYLYFGMLRLVALYLNGTRSPYTAYARILCSVAGAFAWSQMAVSLIVAQSAIAGPPSPTLIILLTVTVMEIDAAKRAFHDARNR